MWCCDRAVLASSRPAGLRPGQHPPFSPLLGVADPPLLSDTFPEHKMQSAKAFLPFTEFISCYSDFFFLFLFFLNNILCRYHGATTQQFAGGVAKTKWRRQSHITPWIAVRRVLEFKFKPTDIIGPPKKKIAGIGEPASASAV